MSIKKRRVFLHFHNYEILKLYGLDNFDSKKLLNHALLLTKYSLLISEEPLLIQPKYLFETKYFEQYLRKINPLINASLIDYTGDAPDFEINEKKNQYRNHDLFSIYSNEKIYEGKLDALKKMRWNPRLASSTQEIKKNWYSDLEDETSPLTTIIKERENGFIHTQEIIKDFRSIPDRLQGEAFILNNVNKMLEKKELNTRQKLTINFQINKSFLLSYLHEYNASILVNTPLSNLDCGIKNSETYRYIISFNDLQKTFMYLDLKNVIEKMLTLTDLIKLRENIYFNSLINFLFNSGSNNTYFLDSIRTQSKNRKFTYCYKDKKKLLLEVIIFIEEICHHLSKYSSFPANQETWKLKLSNSKWLARQKRSSLNSVDEIPIKTTLDLFEEIDVSKKIEKTVINELILILKKNIDEFNLELEKKHELEAEISTIEIQLNSPNPKHLILIESLNSIEIIIESSNVGILTNEILNQLTNILK